MWSASKDFCFEFRSIAGICRSRKLTGDGNVGDGSVEFAAVRKSGGFDPFRRRLPFAVEKPLTLATFSSLSCCFNSQ